MTSFEDRIGLTVAEAVQSLEFIAVHMEKLVGEIGHLSLRLDAVTAVSYQNAKELHALRLAMAAGEGPGFNREFSAYATNDWIADIGAEVVHSDASGPAVVLYAGHLYKRRSGDGTYGQAIWFSRAGGEPGPDGKIGYTRLITFKDLDLPEPLNAALTARIVRALAGAPAPVDELAQHMDGPEEEEAQAAPARLIYGDETEAGNTAAEITTFTQFEEKHDRVPHNTEELRKWYKTQNGK